MGLCGWLKGHRASDIDPACARALESAGSANPSLRAIRQHLSARNETVPAREQPASHPLIRELFVYGQFAQTQTTTQTTNTPSDP
jgi:hypothetical protein